MRGYFTWAVGGYADLFSNIAGLISGDRRFNSDVFRDEAMVALGAGQNDRAFMAETVDQVVGQLDFTAIADLGSGVSARLCRVAAARGGVRGVGLDISDAATRLAGRDVHGVLDREPVGRPYSPRPRVGVAADQPVRLGDQERKPAFGQVAEPSVPGGDRRRFGLERGDAVLHVVRVDRGDLVEVIRTRSSHIHG